jgi:hypothetical protein
MFSLETFVPRDGSVEMASRAGGTTAINILSERKTQVIF